MSPASSGAWYVIQTHVNAEAKAAGHLVRQGFDVYLPRYLKRRSHARKIENVPAPLFPRYLFVWIDVATQRWRSVQSTMGVSNLILNGAGPAPLPKDVVNCLKAREDRCGYVQLDRRPNIALGARVRVLAGVFAENLGLFDGMADRERVAVLLDLLGRKVRVTLDADMVAVA